MKKNLILAAVLMTLWNPGGLAYDTYKVPTASPLFQFYLYNKGESYEASEGVLTSTFTLDNNQRQSIFNSAINWDRILNVIPKPASDKLPTFAVTTNDEFNASAESSYFAVEGLDYKITAINAYINGKTISNPSFTQGHIEIGPGFIEGHPGWDTSDRTEALNHNELANLYTVMEHEIYHALGLSTGAQKEGDLYRFSVNDTEKIAIWDKNLRVYQQNMAMPFDSSKILAPAKGMSIKTEAEGEGTFDIVNYSPYFAGHETLKVISGKDDTDIKMQEYIHSKGGLKNYSIYYQDNSQSGLPTALGLPINGLEKGKDKEDNDLDAELSHIELRNSFLSHQEYRNWSVLMEAELAVLKDIGYTGVEPRKYFGKSYYLNNITDTFNTGFGEWNGTGYSGYSTVADGIGLHIYGDNNVIDQQCNILSNGKNSIGARIEGVHNTYSLTNSQIDVQGNGSIGIASTWGKNHNISIGSGSTVKAMGEGGIGASFDFGKNEMGIYGEDEGSYSYYQKQNITPDVEVQGALADKFTVEGTLSGKKAAIYISENAHVADIDVKNGAVINGNIISKWNSVKSGLNMLVQIQDTSGNWKPVNKEDMSQIYFTNINFSGNTTLNGNIDGSNDIFNTIKLNTDATSNLAYNGKELSVHTINNNGNITFDNADNSPVKLFIQSGSVSGNGTLNFKDGTNLSTMSYIQNTVDIKDSFLSLSDGSKNRIDINKLNTDNAGLYIDYGDKLVLQNKSDYNNPLDPTSGRRDSVTLKQIAVSSSDADSLDSTEQIKLFEEKDMTTPVAISLNVASSANFYNNKNKYTFSQDPTDKSYLKITKTEGNYELADAIADSTTANYIADEEVDITKDLGTVQGDKFEISGDDIDISGHGGLIVDGSTNKTTVLKTNIYGASDSNITLQNGADMLVSTKDEDITIGKNGEVALTIDNSSFIAEVGNNNLTFGGEIKGLNTNTKNQIALAGNTVNLQKADNVLISTQAQTTNINNSLTNSILQITGGTTNIANDSYLGANGSNKLIADGGVLNLANNQASTVNLAQMIMNSDLNVALDVDLNGLSADTFAFTNTGNLVTNGHSLNITNVNLATPKTALTNENYSISLIGSEFNNTNLLGSVNYGAAQNIMTPIFRYELGYNEVSGQGGLSLKRGSESDYTSYNPSIFAGPVAAQMGGYLTQLNSYDEAFRNMDMYMLMPRREREALKMRNKIASLENPKYDDTKSLYEYNAGWFRPYATFEKVGLKNGPRVENTAYGSFFGGDSSLKDLGHGWEGMWGAYIGYNGSHQNYDRTSIYQNGGTIGLTGIAYKNNFFTGLTVNTGANAGEASTMYGNEQFAMLMAGVASKTGYNWELANGKFIIQPSWLMSYSFVNTFDYTNAAGVRIDSDPLHAIQLQPELKFIGNLKNGWQPYVSVAMVWNIMDDTKFKANDVSLPELSVQPYVKYGVGLRKTWGDRFTGFFQTYLTNGGRNGVGLQAGFRWAIGK